MREEVNGTDYTDRGTEAVNRVLIELAQILGAQNGKFVLVGGSVPGLLFKDTSPEHIGTLDIDIELNPEKLGDYGYVDMVEALERHGYERNKPSLKPFQMLRTVEVDDGEPIDIVVDLLMPATSKVKTREEKIVSGLVIQKIDGGDVAIRHSEKITLKGKMPDGRNNEVEILVASIPALLVMKGFAIGNRDKEKDAYDIWFSIKNYSQGIEALAEECRKIIDEPEVKEGYKFIYQKFKARESFGPQTVRKFLQERPDQIGEMDLDEVQTDAHLVVKHWYELLGLADE
jgi:hypothetical protein